MGGSIGVGLIGTGFMGRCHALAFRAAAALFDLPVRPEPVVVADVDLAAARAFARRFGFASSVADWRDLVRDPRVGLVAITAPNVLHEEMALAALAAGKHVYCEKPLALGAEGAATMARAASRAGMTAVVGYNYLANPVIGFARRLIAEGAIGEIVHFRGVNDEDYMADPDVAHSWRCRRAEAGTGTLGDLGSHLVAMALHLAGPIEAVCAEARTVVAERPTPAGGRAAVENEDQIDALVRFAGGAGGTLSSSRVKWGRKNRLAWEIGGTRGTLAFDQERMNELRIHRAGDDGFRTVLAGPAMEPYGAFVPAPGHQLGFNDTKVIEVANLLRAVAGEAPAWPDFRFGHEVERVADAIVRSADGAGWATVRGAL